MTFVETVLKSECHPDLKNMKKQPVYSFIKRFLDIVLSLIGIIVAMPILLIVSLLVLIFDRHSPFYASTRMGKNGKVFKIYKFQTMVTGAKALKDMLSPDEYEEFKKNYKLQRDPRITKLGSVLRKTSIDELPQLFNILKGEMSFVGPRPVLKEETDLYGGDKDALLSVRPGLTGLWQACGRNNIDYESGQRQKMELYYIEHKSLWLDVKIMFMTVKAAITMNGAM